MNVNRRRPVIICSVDQTPLASAVAYAAAGFALQLGASVVLLRTDPRAAGSELEQLTAEGDLEQLADRAILAPTGRHVSTRIVVTTSAPAEAIRQIAADETPLMVVMGSRGRSRLHRSMFGSNSLAMMRDTTLPLLVVPPDGPEIIAIRPDGEAYCHAGRVLIPVDFGPGTAAQLAFASHLLSMKDCHGVLVHVSPTSDDATRRAELDALQAAITAAGTVSTLVVQGDPRRMLQQMASSGEYGLVILGRDRHRAGHLASDLLRESNALIAVTSSE